MNNDMVFVCNSNPAGSPLSVAWTYATEDGGRSLAIADPSSVSKAQ